MKRTIEASRSRYPDLRIAVDDQLAEGDRVATRWTATMTHDGKRITTTGITIDRFERGKIVEAWRSRDMLGLMRQLAVLLVIVPLLSGCLARSANDIRNESAAVTRSDVRHISVAIDRSPRDVYDFASKPENLPRWARGLAESIENVDGEWIARSPMGAVKVRFAPRNAFGVLDHDVTLESGVSVHNPMRVVARDRGRAEVVFTLFRRPGISDAAFEADAGAVQRDLRSLEDVLERASPSAPH